jgi:predicted dehydrogenase
MHGTLADGGLFSIHIEGGKLSGSGVQIDITGDAGDLKITNTSAFGGVDEDFIVTGAQGDSAAPGYSSRPLEHLPIPAKYEWFPRAGLQTGAAELGDLYVALSRDLASGTQVVPTFHDAVWQQQLFEQIQDSSETGKRINL